MSSSYASWNGCRTRRESGFTMFEMLVVSAIVGLAATLAVPNFGSAERERLDVAQKEVVNALEFARTESIRTGDSHGVSVVSADNSIRVFRLVPAGASWTKTYDVRDPISKKLYTIDFDDLTLSNGASVSATFKFLALGTRADVAFSTRGEPIDTVNNLALLEPATIGTVNLSMASAMRTVELQPITGRVSAL